MSFTSLKALLPRAVQLAGVGASVDAAKVVEIAQAALAHLCPPEQRTFIHPVSFTAGVLRVSITSPSAAHAIRLCGVRWIAEMNRLIGRDSVKKITVGRQGF